MVHKWLVSQHRVCSDMTHQCNSREKSASVVSHTKSLQQTILSDSQIFYQPRHTWPMLNHFWTDHVPCLQTSDSMVQPHVDRDRLINVSYLVMVEPNRIRDSIYACIRLLFAAFDVENVSYMHLPFENVRYLPHASRDVNYFLFCG